MSIDFKPIKEAIEDAVSLEVATLTNPLDTPINLATEKENKKIFEAIRQSLTQSDLVAYTKFDLDGDALNFISNNPSLAPLIEKHATLVNSAIETRKALFEGIFTAVKEFIP